jgi:hypothetical protein
MHPADGIPIRTTIPPAAMQATVVTDDPTSPVVAVVIPGVTDCDVCVD